MANPFGQLVDTSRSGGLSIADFWVSLLRWNEQQWDADPSLVLIDEQMKDLVLAAFPSRNWSKGLVAADRYRQGYNRGDFTGVRPHLSSCRYIRQGAFLIRRVPGIQRNGWPGKLALPTTSFVQVTDIVSFFATSLTQ